MKLSEDQIRFFKREGYLLLPGLLDPKLVERALERFWAAAPPDLRPDDPASWPGTFERPDGPSDWRDVREGTQWRYYGAAQEEWMPRLLPLHPPVWDVAEQLLGAGRVATPQDSGGIFCIRPEKGLRKYPRQGHVDKHPHQIRLVGFLSDIVPGGGATNVWPGSHRSFFPCFRSRYLFAPSERYEPMILDADRRPPVDCHGRAGDVLLAHHRIVHKAGHNDSDRLRLAVLCSLWQKDLFGRLFEPPGHDMWADWSDAVRDVDG